MMMEAGVYIKYLLLGHDSLYWTRVARPFLPLEELLGESFYMPTIDSLYCGKIGV